MGKERIMSQDCCSTTTNSEHEHDHNHGEVSLLKTYFPAILSGSMLALGIAMDYFNWEVFQNDMLRILWYIVAYIPVGFPVLLQGFRLILKGEFFTEFSLMSVATIGAFILGEYPEGVAVMLFYAVGELFQSAAVNKARNNIKSLLDVRPNSANVFRENKWQSISPERVEIGERIQVKLGEKVPLDGILISDFSSFNTSALTGESKPETFRKGETVLAGMLNEGKLIEIQTTKKFNDSSLAKILEMVQEASSRKAKTELFIRKFAKVYTPAVFFLAVAVMLLPFFFVENYMFREWFYRALIFLVISCPCALVISIPLGYFGGIGAASRNGILFKGSNFLDLMAKVNTVVLDKTGTLTRGVFKVQKVKTEGLSDNEFLEYASALERNSTHPVAKAVAEFYTSKWEATEVEEFSGMGLKGMVNGKEVLAGNGKLMAKFGIEFPKEIESIIETIVLVSIDKIYAGYILISDEMKADAAQAISEINKAGVSQIMMLSGDRNSIVQKTASEVGIGQAFGELLPEGKVEKIKELKENPQNIVAFVGDGINDAPVLALSDIGIAMGGMGSDLAIETADVVIQTDQPSKIATAIKIGRKTKQIVIQNITLAFVVKLIVMILGAGGLATMWEAVFADVGVALLAILNAVRIQNRKF